MKKLTGMDMKEDRMSASEIISVCKTRELLSISCRRCEYTGKRCDKYKEEWSVDRPSQHCKPIGGKRDGNFKEKQ